MEGLKPTLHRWGLPQAMKFDNGQPFADTTANMIPPLALWLLGIGIELIYNRPNSPQANAKVERCQGTSARWAEPGQTASAAQLKHRLEEVCHDHVFRYPTRVCSGKTRIVCFPELLENPRLFQPEQFDLSKVMDFVARGTYVRSVSKTGQIAIFKARHCLGQKFKYQEVTLKFDPHHCEWVVYDRNGTMLKKFKATNLTKENILNLKLSKNYVKT